MNMVKMMEEIYEQPQVLRNCTESNMKIIKKILDGIKHKEISSVTIAARGTSDHAAIYGKYIIKCLIGLPVSLAAP